MSSLVYHVRCIRTWNLPIFPVSSLFTTSPYLMLQQNQTTFALPTGQSLFFMLQQIQFFFKKPPSPSPSCYLFQSPVLSSAASLPSSPPYHQFYPCTTGLENLPSFSHKVRTMYEMILSLIFLSINYNLLKVKKSVLLKNSTV